LRVFTYGYDIEKFVGKSMSNINYIFILMQIREYIKKHTHTYIIF